MGVPSDGLPIALQYSRLSNSYTGDLAILISEYFLSPATCFAFLYPQENERAMNKITIKKKMLVFLALTFSMGEGDNKWVKAHVVKHAGKSHDYTMLRKERVHF